MAYSDFTMAELKTKFGIKEQPLIRLFLKPSPLLLQELDDAQYLREVWRVQERWFQLFSGYSFNVSEVDRLTRVCDYLFSTERTVTEIKYAVFCLIEAKNRALIEGVP
jgi:hypothetical protein